MGKSLASETKITVAAALESTCPYVNYFATEVATICFLQCQNDSISSLHDHGLSFIATLIEGTTKDKGLQVSMHL